jgi:hypothetical protein
MDTILFDLAPCGLDCSRCVSYKFGRVKEISKELAEHLQNFAARAEKMSAFVPVLKEYNTFEETLKFLMNGDCNGCRKGDGKYPECAAKTCAKEQNVDFCFQCEEFPCKRNQYPEALEKRWIANNMRMKEVGVKQYYSEQKSKPRYE